MRHRVLMSLYAALCVAAIAVGFGMANSSNGLSMVYLLFLTLPLSMLGSGLAAIFPGSSSAPLIWVGIVLGFSLNLWLIWLIFRPKANRQPAPGSGSTP